MRKESSTTSRQYSRGEVLRHPGLRSLRSPASFVRAALHHHLMRRLDLGGHVGQPEQHGLVVGDLLAERLALLGVADAELEGAQRDATAAGGHVDAAHLDAVHHLVEAAARSGAEDLTGRNPVAGEQQLGRVDALVAHLLDLAGHGEAGRDSPNPVGFSTSSVVMFR